MGLIEEIGEQPDVSRRLLRELPPALAPVVAAVRERDVAFVTIAARGSSDHAGIYAQYVLGALARLPVALATPSLITRYRRAPRLGGSLVIGISQSGRSPDVVGVVDEARRQGAVTVAITNDPAAPLAAAAEHRLPLLADERAIAATKTYTASLLVVAMLAAALSDDPAAAAEELGRLATAQERALEGAERAAQLGVAFAAADTFVVLGRGYNLPTAFESALKLKELAGVHAQGYSTADFQHGPVASLATGGAVLAIRARGPMLAELDGVLARLRDERQARIVGVGATPMAGVEQLPLPDDLPEWLSPLVAIIPVQLFAATLTTARGLDHERPHGLSKVTLTR